MRLLLSVLQIRIHLHHFDQAAIKRSIRKTLAWNTGEDHTQLVTQGWNLATRKASCISASCMSFKHCWFLNIDPSVLGVPFFDAAFVIELSLSSSLYLFSSARPCKTCVETFVLRAGIRRGFRLIIVPHGVGLHRWVVLGCLLHQLC